MPDKKQSIPSLEKMSLSNLIGMYTLAAIVIAGLAGYFLIMPQLDAANEAKNETKLVETEIQGLNQLIEDTETLRENYSDIKHQRNQIVSLLPKSNEEEYLLVLTNQVASRNGVVMSSFRPSTVFDSEVPAGNPGGVENTYESFQAEINVSGTYEQLRGFLQDMESSSRFVTVTELTSSTDGVVAADDPNITASVTIEGYYQLESNQQQAGETSRPGERR